MNTSMESNTSVLNHGIEQVHIHGYDNNYRLPELQSVYPGIMNPTDGSSDGSMMTSQGSSKSKRRNMEVSGSEIWNRRVPIVIPLPPSSHHSCTSTANSSPNHNTNNMTVLYNHPTSNNSISEGGDDGTSDRLINYHSIVQSSTVYMNWSNNTVQIVKSKEDEEKLVRSWDQVSRPGTVGAENTGLQLIPTGNPPPPPSIMSSGNSSLGLISPITSIPPSIPIPTMNTRAPGMLFPAPGNHKPGYMLSYKDQAIIVYPFFGSGNMKLPKLLLLYIIDYLSDAEINSISAINNVWYSVANDEALWE